MPREVTASPGTWGRALPRLWFGRAGCALGACPAPTAACWHLPVRRVTPCDPSVFLTGWLVQLDSLRFSAAQQRC